MLVSLVTAIGLWESMVFFSRLLFQRKWRILSYAAGLFMPFGTYLWGITGLNITLFISFFAALSLMMLSCPLDRDQIGRIALLSFAWLYLPYFMSFILLIGAAPQGRFWILFVLVVTVAETPAPTTPERVSAAASSIKSLVRRRLSRALWADFFRVSLPGPSWALSF